METTILYWGLYWDNGKENGNYYIILGGYIGIMEKKMETTTSAAATATATPRPQIQLQLLWLLIAFAAATNSRDCCFFFAASTAQLESSSTWTPKVRKIIAQNH